MTGHGRVRLEPLSRDHLGHIHRWSSDPEICALIGEPVAGIEEVEDWFARTTSEASQRWFVVFTRDDGRPIGEAGLLRIDPRWRTADMSIVLGERDAWRQGLGTEVAEMLLGLAFRRLALHRVAVGVVGFNERALLFWESLGFRREGIQRDGYFHEGRFYDFVMLSILEAEWKALHG